MAGQDELETWPRPADEDPTPITHEREPPAAALAPEPSPSTDVRPLAWPLGVDLKYQPSDQVHILGADTRAAFVAHSMCARRPAPAPRILFFQHGHRRTWEEEEQCISVFRDGKYCTRKRIVGEYIGPSRRRRVPSEQHIDNLVITLPPSRTIAVVTSIKHRIDHRTTICLIQNGLGVKEALDQFVFPDLVTRPAYILGHMSHILSRHERCWTLAEEVQGKLCLTAAFRDANKFPGLKFYPPVERLTRERHMLRLLTTAPDLCGGGYTMGQFLQRKLPDMAFAAAVDTVLAALDFSYDQIRPNPHVRSLIDRVLDEICQVVAALPEAQDSPGLLDYVRGGRLKRDCRALMMKRVGSKHPSETARRLHWGGDTDVKFLNGYFVRRGNEVGVECPTNETVMEMLKCRHVSRMMELDEFISTGERSRNWRPYIVE